MLDFAAVFMRLRAIRDPYAGRLERTVDRAWSVGDRGFLGWTKILPIALAVALIGVLFAPVPVPT